jgi:hypothetical protein
MINLTRFSVVLIPFISRQEMEQVEDRLSNLPKIILHNILSWLQKEDAAKTSVLSKAWLETWYTFPNLSFCDFQFIRKSSQPVEDIVGT